MPQTYPRYGARDFERRWQARLNRPPRHTTNKSSQLHAEVTHRFPASNRYGWELRRVAGLPVEESRVQFTSWEEASQAATRCRIPTPPLFTQQRTFAAAQRSAALGHSRPSAPQQNAINSANSRSCSCAQSSKRRAFQFYPQDPFRYRADHTPHGFGHCRPVAANIACASRRRTGASIQCACCQQGWVHY